MQKFERLQFVQHHKLGLNGFGIIEEATEENVLYVMTASMEDNFGVDEYGQKDVKVLSEEEIQEALKAIKEDEKQYVYFIIQLNDIPELVAYHIEESDYVKEVRNTNETLLNS